MPGSGIWNDGETKDRAGFYMRFKAASLATIQGGESGVGAIPVKANWGPMKQVVSISKGEAELKDMFGSDTTGGFTAYTAGRLALLGGPKQLLIYRLADGNEEAASYALKDGASATIVTLETLYPTTRPFKVTVRDSLTDSANFKEILLYEGTSLLVTFPVAKGASVADNIVSAVSAAADNRYIKATKVADGNGILADVTSQDFGSGNAGASAVTNQHYIDAMAAFEAYDINGFTLDGYADGSLQASVKAWVQRLRDGGMDLMAFLGGSATDDQTYTNAKTRALGFNHEGVVSVGVSGIMNGVTYSSAEVACWVMGRAIGQPLTASMTNEPTPFEDVAPRLTDPQIKELLKAGVFLLTNDGEGVVCERGINTKTTFGAEENRSWRKIKIIRLRGAISRALTKTAKAAYVGKIPNSPEGQDALLAAIKLYLEGLAPSLLVGTSIVVRRDEAKMANAEGDQFYWEYAAKEIDNMEEIYGTGNV